MSHLKKQYDLEIPGNVRKLLSLNDRFPLTEISQRRVIGVCIRALKEISAPDLENFLVQARSAGEHLADLLKLETEIRALGKTFSDYLSQIANEKTLQTIIEKMGLDNIRNLCKMLLPTLGLTEIPYANKIGIGLAKDYTNWLAQTSLRLICNDPNTVYSFIQRIT